MRAAEQAVEARAVGLSTADPFRIVLLVPHEPDLDPRIQWVAGLCASIGRTDVFGAVPDEDRLRFRGTPEREYAEGIYVERIRIPVYASKMSKALCAIVGCLSIGAYVAPFLRLRTRRSSGASQVPNGGATAWRSWTVVGAAGRLSRFVRTWASHLRLVSALYRRARAMSVVPRVMICHDWMALAAAVRIKKRMQCPIIYDSHEFWPDADLLACTWERRFMAFVEGRLIRNADAVITVSPQLARHLERQYGLTRVISVPNAEPRGGSLTRRGKPAGTPVRFLFQGRVTRGRGIETMLDEWAGVADARGVLYVRCPESEYFSELCARYRPLIERGRLVVLEPVGEKELIAAASFADVGIIPYAGTNPNLVYCCPNKLSQYMQAGLAILSNNLEYVAQVLRQHRCGLVYDAREPQSFARAVRRFLDHSDELEKMKALALHAAQTEFNWEVQSAPYRDLVQHVSGEAPRGGCPAPPVAATF